MRRSDAAALAQVQTQSLLHAGWKNFTDAPRKALVTAWFAAGIPHGVGDVAATSRELGAIRRALERWAPERAHTVPATVAEHCHFDNGTVGAPPRRLRPPMQRLRV